MLMLESEKMVSYTTYSVMQSNSICGDVVLDSFNKTHQDDFRPNVKSNMSGFLL